MHRIDKFMVTAAPASRQPKKRETGAENGTGTACVRQVDDASGMTLLIPTRTRTFLSPQRGTLQLTSRIFLSSRLPHLPGTGHDGVGFRYTFARCKLLSRDTFKNYRPRSAIINNPPFSSFFQAPGERRNFFTDTVTKVVSLTRRGQMTVYHDVQRGIWPPCRANVT